MSFSRYLLIMGVKATWRQLFGHVTLLFFGTGMMTVDLKQVGTVLTERERFKMFLNISASWFAHVLRAALRMLMHLNSTSTSSSAMTRALAVSSLEEVLSRRLV